MIRKILYLLLVKGAKSGLYRSEKIRFGRKLKYLAMFAVGFFLVLGGLTVWGVASAISYVSATVQQESFKENLDKSREKLSELASEPITTQDCLNTLGSMVLSTRLLTEPLMKSWDTVRDKCLRHEKGTQDRK